jgi:hypothetical protein
MKRITNLFSTLGYGKEISKQVQVPYTASDHGLCRSYSINLSTKHVAAAVRCTP